MITCRSRRRRVDRIVAAALISLAATAVVAGKRQRSAETPAVPASAVALADVGPQKDPEEFNRVGEATIGTLCATECHDAEQVFTVRRSSHEWDLVVGDMVRRGVKGTPTDLELVRRYLTWSFGSVEVNSAPAGELSGVVGIPLAMAQAIVSYRDTHGRFADLDALLKVPGIDRPTIEAQLYALRFD